MSKLIRFAAFASILLLLASCGGDRQRDVREGPVMSASHAQSATAGPDSPYEDLVQRLYIAYFGRPADPAGLTFYVSAFRSANAPLTAGDLFGSYKANPTVRGLVDGFANSTESNQLYSGSNLAHGFVYAIYDNLFSRDPDAAGADYWSKLLESGRASRANVLLAILAGAQGSDAELVVRKAKIASQFTHGLDAAGKRAVYDGQLANLVMRAMIRSTPSLQDDSAIRAAIDEATSRLSVLHSGSFVEAAGGTHKIVLLVSADQLTANALRLSALADVLTADLNKLRPGGPSWSVAILTAATTVSAVRDQLRLFDSALLIGRIPMPTANGVLSLDAYRLPDCPLLKVDGNGTVSGFLTEGIDPRCVNGAVISVLRGPSLQTESTDIARKLDQMIAYHKASSLKNSAWLQRLRYIHAGWFGGVEFHQAGMFDALAGLPLSLQPEFDSLDSGDAAQRRDAFVDCITHNNEICGANVHGAAQFLQFEGPGADGTYYSSDSIDWSPNSLAARSVKAKYIALDSCNTQNFLQDQSVGSMLLMNGDTMLTSGSTESVWISNHHQEDVIRNEYSMLLNGSTFVEAFYGRLEGSFNGIQGDPYITMRPVPAGPQPKLVINGTHHNRGAVPLTITFPDSVNGAKLTQVVTYSNRGDADLHLRLGTVPRRSGVDAGSPIGFEPVAGDGSVVYIEFIQTYSDGRVLTWPAFEAETQIGTMHATVRPGQSVAISYRLNVPVGMDGKPKRVGQYGWEVTNTSDDPASGRVIMAMTARVR